MNPDSIGIAIFGVRSADAVNPDSIRIEIPTEGTHKTPGATPEAVVRWRH